MSIEYRIDSIQRDIEGTSTHSITLSVLDFIIEPFLRQMKKK